VAVDRLESSAVSRYAEQRRRSSGACCAPSAVMCKDIWREQRRLHACAKGDTRDETPPSSSCSASVHAIRSSCAVNIGFGSMSRLYKGPSMCANACCKPGLLWHPRKLVADHADHGGTQATCSVSPPIMAASSSPSGRRARRAWLSAPCKMQPLVADGRLQPRIFSYKVRPCIASAHGGAAATPNCDDRCRCCK